MILLVNIPLSPDIDILWDSFSKLSEQLYGIADMANSDAIFLSSKSEEKDVLDAVKLLDEKQRDIKVILRRMELIAEMSAFIDGPIWLGLLPLLRDFRSSLLFYRSRWKKNDPVIELAIEKNLGPSEPGE